MKTLFSTFIFTLLLTLALNAAETDEPSGTETAETPAPVSIAVLDFSAKDVSAYNVKAFTSGIIAELRQRSSLAVTEQNQPAAACQNNECAAAAGSRLGVQKIIWGTIEKQGILYKISARLTDVESLRVEETLDEEVTEADLGSAAKLSAIALVRNIPDAAADADAQIRDAKSKLAVNRERAKREEEEKQRILREQARKGVKKFSVFAGGELNLLTTSGIAAGPLLGGYYRYSDTLAFGIKAGGYFGSGVTGVETIALGRWYFHTLSKFYNAELFAQAELGVVFLQMDYDKTVPTFLGGLAAGARVPVGDKWFTECYIRAGYPHMAGLGVVFGMKL